MDANNQQQDSIRRLVQNQYDQLLHYYEKIRTEVDRLSSPATGGPAHNYAEIVRLRGMLTSMEQDIQTKRQELVMQYQAPNQMSNINPYQSQNHVPNANSYQAPNQMSNVTPYQNQMPGADSYQMPNPYQPQNQMPTSDPYQPPGQMPHVNPYQPQNQVPISDPYQSPNQMPNANPYPSQNQAPAMSSDLAAPLTNSSPFEHATRSLMPNDAMIQSSESLNPRDRLNLHPRDPFAGPTISQPPQSMPSFSPIPPAPTPEIPIARPQVPEHLRSITEGLNMHNMTGDFLEPAAPHPQMPQMPAQLEPNPYTQVPQPQTERVQDLYAQPTQPEPISQANFAQQPEPATQAIPNVNQHQPNEANMVEEPVMTSGQAGISTEPERPTPSAYFPEVTEGFQPPEPPKLWQKILGILGNVSFYAFLLIAVAAVVLFGTQEPDAPPRNLFGFSAMTVLTGSMEPEIPRRSIIIIREREAHEFQVEDVVTYLRQSNNRTTTITHRIIDVTENFGPEGQRGFQLQGDANAFPDNEIIAADNIIGEVIWHNVMLGQVIFFIQTVPILFALLVILFMVLVYVIKAIFKKPELPEGTVLVNGVPVPLPQDPRLAGNMNTTTFAPPHQAAMNQQMYPEIAPPVVDKKALKAQKKKMRKG